MGWFLYFYCNSNCIVFKFVHSNKLIIYIKIGSLMNQVNHFVNIPVEWPCDFLFYVVHENRTNDLGFFYLF